MKYLGKFKQNLRVMLPILLAFGVFMSSCENDDDGDGNGGPNGNFNAEQGSYDATIQGDYNAELKGGQASFELGPNAFTPEKFDSTKDAALTIYLEDTTKQEANALTLFLFKKNADKVNEGTFEINLQDNSSGIETGSGVLLETAGSNDQYSLSTNSGENEGSIELTTVSENMIEGTINDVYLVKRPQTADQKSVRINGEFKAEQMQNNDDGDDGDDSDNFNAEKGSYDAKVEGDYSTEMKGGQAIFQKELSAFFNTRQYDSTEDAGMMIVLGDTTKEKSNELLIVIYKNDAEQVDEGTYDITMQNDQHEIKTGSGALLATPGETTDYTQSPENDGSITLNSVSETEVTGTIDDVEMKKIEPNEEGAATINGAFKAEPSN